MLKKKSVGQRVSISRHKHIVIAALAVSGMLLYAIPAPQLASATEAVPLPPIVGPIDDDHQEQNLAQRLVDDTRQRIDQDARQDQDQRQDQDIDQHVDQTNTADVDQSEVNDQDNVITTGDNIATTTQIGDNDATDASAAIEQEVDNEATTTQDSSTDDNVLVNENTFGNDIAVVDQDNVADQHAVNVGIQTQEQDLNQYALNLDLDAQLGSQSQELVDDNDISLGSGGRGDPF